MQDLPDEILEHALTFLPSRFSARSASVCRWFLRVIQAYFMRVKKMPMGEWVLAAFLRVRRLSEGFPMYRVDGIPRMTLPFRVLRMRGYHIVIQERSPKDHRVFVNLQDETAKLLVYAIMDYKKGTSVTAQVFGSCRTPRFKVQLRGRPLRHVGNTSYMKYVKFTSVEVLAMLGLAGFKPKEE